jgi:gluconolactonase
VFEAPAYNQNGHCLDRQGRVVSCEHRGRAVTRIGFDGRREVLADAFNGQRLNSPNDVVVKSDGSIWFTDPTYGIDSDYEGDAAPSEIGASNVYRIDGRDGSVVPVVTDMVRPNGLAFSPDESILYVADTGLSHVGRACPPDIRAYPMAADGSAPQGPFTTFATCDNGAFDGFRVDVEGNIWSSAGDGVHCFAPDGTLLGKIRIPEVVANVELGGLKRNRLYICATTSLFAMYLNTRAAI